MSRFLAFSLYLILLLASLAAAAFGVMNYLTLARGIESGVPPQEKIWGTNVALERYTTDPDLDRALELMRAAGLHYVRQYFPWREIEPTRGVFDWTKWDRMVEHARRYDLRIVAVLTTAPAWAQRDDERDLPTAPPADFAEFARFASDFAKRYGSAIDDYQIWDEPNVPPTWGRRNADPVEYAQMLMPASEAIRASDSNARIVLAGLAMNVRTQRPHPDYSEILFLRGLYEIGANKYFDVVAAKPYGMWTGPEDRQVNSAILNFSRVILLRDEMLHYGDAAKPVWLVEMGWNALPAEWAGAPSPWGTDSDDKQADRLARALTRVESEWQWVTGLFPLYLEPNAPPSDPRWGFALVNPDFSPRPAYDALAQFVKNPQSASTALPVPPWLPVALLAGVALVSAWRAWDYAFVMRVDTGWRALATRFRALPEIVQLATLGLAVLAFYVSPRVPLNFILLGILVLLFALRLDFGLALTVATIPFWNFPKTLVGSFQFSMVEALTWVSVAAWTMDALLSQGHSRNRVFQAKLRACCQTQFGEKPGFLGIRLAALDWAVVALIVLGLLSTQIAGNFGVAMREFRLVVLDPALLYGVIRLSNLPLRQIHWLVYALLASGVAVCVVALAQWLTGDVIVADDLRRVRAVWGSPNNVALYLGRLLPIALAFTLLLRRVSARWIYAALVLLYSLVIYLTFSRGAFFLGVPAAVIFIGIGLWSRSRAWTRRNLLLVGGAAAVGVLALIPLVGTARFNSLFEVGTGTGFFRIAVWTSAIRMIRDHWLFGVGLDNFLYEYPKYILPEAWREPNLSHPHNLLLDFWVRLGILGVGVLIWMVVVFFRRAWRVFGTSENIYPRALALGLMASMVDFIAHGMIDAAFFYIDLAYVFIVTLALVEAISANVSGGASARSINTAPSA